MNVHRLMRLHLGVFGEAAAVAADHPAHDAIAGVPALDAGTDRVDFARRLGTADLLGAVHRASRDHLATVEAGGTDADHDLTRPDLGRGNVARLERRATVLGSDPVGFHPGGSGVGSPG